MPRRGPSAGEAPGQTPLFAPDELTLRRAGAARFAEIVRLPARAPTVAERIEREDRRILERLREQATDLGRAFRLRGATIDRERPGVNEHYGICYADGTIRIRLRHATTGRLLKESSLVDTLCHELAHLRHFDHSPRFRALYLSILEAARERGYYRPGPGAGPSPRQASLPFEATCGTAVR